MITHRRTRLLAVLLVGLLTCATLSVWADDPVPVDCSTITSYPHLKDWNHGNAVEKETIYLLNLYYSVSANTDSVVKALETGMRAAFEARAYTTESGRTVEVVDVIRSEGEPDSPKQYITEALCRFEDRLFGVLGPFHDNRLSQLLNTYILKNNSLVALGPYTGSSSVRFFTTNTYFMRADPVAELATMLNYIINHKLHRRVGFAIIENHNFGDLELAEAAEYIERVGSKLVAVYKGDGSQDEVDAASLQGLIDTEPQSIIVYCSPGVQAGKLFSLLLKNEKLRDCNIFVPSFLNYELVAAAYAIEADKDKEGMPITTAHRERLFSTSTSYPTYDTSLHHIVAFREQMTTYIASHPGDPYSDAGIIDTVPVYAELMLTGWIVGQMVFEILFFEMWARSREALMAGLFRQNRFIFAEDFVLGDYGGACRSDQLARQGATCGCNQGGSTAFLMQHHPNGSIRSLPDWVFTYDSRLCYARNARMPMPVNLITMNFGDDPLFEHIDSQLRAPGQLAVSSLNQQVLGSGGNSYNLRVMYTTTGTAQSDLEHFVANQRVDVILGPVLLGLDPGEALILSPTYRKPHVTVSDPNKVVLRATLEQQLYVACDFLSDPSSSDVFSKGSQVRLVLRDVDKADADQIIEVAKKTTTNFGLKKPKVMDISNDEALDRHLGKNGVALILGLQRGDAAALVHYLEHSPKSLVLLPFQDVMMFYDELVDAFEETSEEVAGRLVFATSFPVWNDVSEDAYAEYPILKSFHAAMGDAKYYTPLAFEAYVTTRLVELLASSLQTIDAHELREQLYHASNFLIDGLQLGPFTNCDPSDARSNKNKRCVLRNYGARDISLVSIRHVVTPSQNKLFGPTTPDMTYEKPVMTKAQIVVTGVCGGLALIAMVVIPVFVCLYCCVDSRDNKNAPKDTLDPVTLIFTDIESSTALWGTVPQIMPDAVATHHKIIREVIAAHKCYEVKTVGDSFMIACKQPFAAVQIAQDIQKRFLTHDWAEEIDDCYRQFEQRRADDPDNDSYTPHSANLVRGIYEALWHGLRVRIGVHTGLADIRHDEITGGFDYYGETSNMAARTEAIGNGGQVLLTDATWWALSQAERDALDATSLGSQPLRGVGYPVTMYQLNVATGRQYPPLRLDIDACLPNDDETDGDSTAASDMASSAATLTGPAAAIATVLTNCFSPYPAARRVKELQPLLQKWGIPVPPRHRNVSEEDYCRGLVNRLALKMSSVVLIRSKLDGGRATGPLGASATASACSRASNATLNPFDTTGHIAAGASNLAALASHRTSRRPSRLPPGVLTAQLTPRQSHGGSATGLVEMADVMASSRTTLTHLGPDGVQWDARAPPLQPRDTDRRRHMGLAALSPTSDANSSIHVMMPTHLQR